MTTRTVYRVDENARLRAVINSQARRLDYAVMQMREAKFKRVGGPEDARFLRAYGVVMEVRDTLRDTR